ncbi:MAG TPA: thiamine-phosphate kinase [Gemmatimonadales bacterium]|nr:thiamine-phosphate kinase [Gemmatimonadales bacterium]
MKSKADPGRTLALGPGAEFDRIRGIIQVLGPNATGLGDDCALFPSGDTFFALSTDVSVEGIHFRLDWISLEEAGWRAAAAALSDLAAEGATPLGVLSAVTMPDSASEADLLQMMRGVGAAGATVGATVSGGDLSSGSAWSIAVTVIGKTSQPVTRAGARPGDALWVTGALGGSRAALEAWRRGAEPPPEARRRYAHPEPRVTAGQWLARRGARAMLDLSDGLAGDAAHLAAASAVAVEIDLALLPVALEVKQEAARLAQSSERFAAEAGEDFELLAALPPEFDGATEFTRACGIPLTRIGTITSGKGVRFILEGRTVELRGFNHFG